jgi:bifunctional ADP-heptose synthase (sugar kinase/adenylyltransferase)
MIQPDILVKGGDYSTDKIVGADVVKARGGHIQTIPFVEGYSTTAIENKIRKTK